MPKRKIQPEIITNDIISIPEIQKKNLSGIPVYLINAGDQDIVKVDFIFNVGKTDCDNPLIPETVSSLIDKGTKKLTSGEISENLDFYGAYFETESGKHFTVITLYTLNKYFEQTFKIVNDFLFNAIFPEKETDIFLKNRFQTFLINRQKPDIISSEVFAQSLFGENHPYGRSVKKEDFNDINRENILEFYKSGYSSANLQIMFTGKITDKHVKLADKFLNEIKNGNTLKKEHDKFRLKQISARKKIIEMPGTVQSSLRIGKITVNKTHPDFFNLNIATVILGGYFGSRLMTNIREDKGYTYGIYASGISLPEAGYLVISAESGKNVYKKAIEEIYKELKKLRSEPVAHDELTRVKRWIFGSTVKVFDGPLSVSEAYKSLIFGNLSADYFHRYLNAVKNITPEMILETAQKYFDEDTLTEVVAGA